MLEVLVHECIHAFKDIRNHGKGFAREAKVVGFEKPYTQINPSQWLVDNCKSIHAQLVQQYGEFPGKPIVIHKKEKKGSKNTILFFCPECGYEVKTTKKIFEKYHQGLPTCMCGTKMARDVESENDEPDSEDKDS